MIGTVKLIAFDEGGVAGPAEHRRLVCEIEGGGKVAVWGRDGSRHNIDAVLNAGTPCTIECNWRVPNPEHARKYEHTHWVMEDSPLRIVKDGKAEAKRP